MRETVKPALSPDEWDGGETAWPRVSLATTRSGPLRVSDHDDNCVTVEDRDLPAVMALANAALPAGHPNKLTHADAEVLARLTGLGYGALGTYPGGYAAALTVLTRLGAKLAALLPPPAAEAGGAEGEGRADA